MKNLEEMSIDELKQEIKDADDYISSQYRLARIGGVRKRMGAANVNGRIRISCAREIKEKAESILSNIKQL